MKYIGNKTRLLNFISEAFDKENFPTSGVLFDIFGGTGAVGNFFKKKGFKIISNDLMTYSFIQQYVSVTINKTPLFNNITSNGLKGVIEILNNLPEKKGYAFNNYAPSGIHKRRYFSDNNAMKIDAIRDTIQEWKEKNIINNDEYYVLLYSLINAADFVANISGTYGAYLKIWRSMALKQLTLKEPEIYDNSLHNEIYQGDANNIVSKVNYDILYIDPPYNNRQYAPNFHVLESLAVWDKQELNGITGQRNYDDKKSAYCSKKEAIIAFERLIKETKAKYIAFSYSNEGIMNYEDIIKILKSKGKVSEYETDYRRFRTEQDNKHRQYKKCNDKVKEYLFMVSCH